MLENRLQRRHPLIQIILDNWIYVLVAILMWRLPNILGDYFDQDIRPRRPQGNQPIFWMGVAIQLYILVILAMGYNLIFGFGGILSFGHALFFGIGVYVVVILVSDYGYSVENSAAVALMVSVLFGLFTALAVFRIRGIYFAMFTLALAQGFHDLVRVNLFKFLTQGDDGRTLSAVPDWINPIQNRLSFYYLCAFLAGLTFVLIRRLLNSPTGKVILAIRENEERVQTMGYNVALYKALVIVMGSLFGSLAGVLQAIFTRQAEPTSLSLTRTIDPLFMMIIGGTGTHPGPVVGGIIMHLGETFFRKPELRFDLDFILFEVSGTLDTVEVWRLILGAMFVLIVLFIPNGVVGQFNLLYLQARRWFRKFIYDRIIRANPGLARYGEPFTGEPPQVAVALAESTRDASLMQWVREYPAAAVYSACFVIALLGGIITWDQHTFFSLILFFLLITVPVFLPLWIFRNFRDVIPGLQGRIDSLRDRL